MPGDVLSHATFWNGGTVTDLGTLGSSYSTATDINGVGQVVGNSYLQGDASVAAVTWIGGAITSLGSLGGTNASSAQSINSVGQIVGWSLYPTPNPPIDRSAQHATLWDGATVTDLNSFLNASDLADGWELITANDINDDGWIVGLAYNTLTSRYHGFLLSDAPFDYYPAPANIPEPGTLALLALGLAALGYSRRKQ